MINEIEIMCILSMAKIIKVDKAKDDESVKNGEILI